MQAALLAICGALFFVPSAGADFDCGASLFRCQAEIDNGGRVWFTSGEKLTEDALGDGTPKGGVFQVYRRGGNQTVLVSRRPDGQPIQPENRQRIAAMLLGVSPDGERVYMQTDASLVAADVDAGREGGSTDGYLLSGGAYELLTTGPLDDAGPNPNPYRLARGLGLRRWQLCLLRDCPAAGRGGLGQRFGHLPARRRSDAARLDRPGPTLPTAEFPNPSIPKPAFSAPRRTAPPPTSRRLST